MALAEEVARRFTVPRLTPGRIWLAFTVALVTDGLQLFLGPLGWFLVDQGLDVLAMVLTCAALGFHMLLLPTFIVEMLPVADWLPTWTGCVAVVVALRKRAETQPVPPPLAAAPPQLPTQGIPRALPQKPAQIAEK